ncbi:DUF5819 family protein [Streptomyces sp. NPDC050844]|uniref:DUF5819 family protein n=1 Tax=Streptomyces sp. NPDC050844 TaxID=3155790 RepID=UPI0033DC33B1
MDANDNSASEPSTPPPTGAPSGTDDAPTVPSAPPSGITAPPTGIAALSPRYQIAAVLALVIVAATVCVHVAMLFLHVAPANTMTKQHGEVVDDWIYPEFEQNWKLFAPNPMQQNIAVQARAEIRTEAGTTRTTRWYDLSAQDSAAIDGNLLPSHTQQNELRRAWDFYVGSHDAQNRPSGLRGQLAERYLHRIALLRVDRAEPIGKGDAIERVQVRSRTTNVPAPEWSDEKVAAKPAFRLLPWSSVISEDMPLAKDREDAP